MVVGVDGLLPKDAKGGEQADGVCGDQVEVQAEAWGDLYYSSEVRELGSEEFHARLQKEGQITVPIEIVEGEALSKGDVMKVRILVRDE